jgi:hypothetical protein
MVRSGGDMVRSGGDMVRSGGDMVRSAQSWRAPGQFWQTSGDFSLHAITDHVCAMTIHCIISSIDDRKGSYRPLPPIVPSLRARSSARCFA